MCTCAAAGSNGESVATGRHLSDNHDFDFSNFNPEAFFAADERSEILVLSDDGSLLIDGTPCKQLRNPRDKFFRGVWIAAP